MQTIKGKASTIPTKSFMPKEAKWVKPVLLTILAVLLTGVATYLILNYSKWKQEKRNREDKRIAQIVDMRTRPTFKFLYDLMTTTTKK